MNTKMSTSQLTYDLQPEKTSREKESVLLYYCTTVLLYILNVKKVKA